MTTELLEPTAPASAAPSDPTPAPAPTPAVKELTVLQRSLALVKNTVKEFDGVEAGLAKLRKKYLNVVFDVSTTKGMKEACEARMAIREPRYAVKKALDDAKKPLNALKADITERAEALTAEILLLETPIHEQIVAEETRKAKEKDEREAADRARILAITERIAAMRAQVNRANECRSAARVKLVLDGLAEMSLDGMDEFEGEAILVHCNAMKTIGDLHAAKVASEAEAEALRAEQAAESARIEAERAELNRLREEQAQRERVAAEALAEQQAALAREREAFEAQQRAAEPAPMREVKPMSDREWAALPAGDRELPHHIVYGTQAQPQPAADIAMVPGSITSPTDGDDDIVDAEVRAGFDAAMTTSLPVDFAQHDGTPCSFTDEEAMNVAIEAVSHYFEVDVHTAMKRLAEIQQWAYRGHLAAV